MDLLYWKAVCVCDAAPLGPIRGALVTVLKKDAFVRQKRFGAGGQWRGVSGEAGGAGLAAAAGAREGVQSNTQRDARSGAQHKLPMSGIVCLFGSICSLPPPAWRSNAQHPRRSNCYVG